MKPFSIIELQVVTITMSWINLAKEKETTIRVTENMKYVIAYFSSLIYLQPQASAVKQASDLYHFWTNPFQPVMAFGNIWLETFVRVVDS